MNSVRRSRDIWGRQLGLLLLFAAFLVMPCAVGCSVKEDRTPCPSMLIVSTAGLAEPHPIHVWGDGSYHFFSRIIPDDNPSDWRARVQKGFNVVAAFRGLDRSELQDCRVIIPEGQESDRLFSHRSVVDCTGEYAYDTLRLHKQHCVLTINIEGYRDLSDTFPYDIEVRGESCGYDLRDGTPVRGAFRASPRTVGEAIMQVILPRQRPDGSLDMVFSIDGQEEARVDVAAILLQEGYSWERMDLDDAALWVDYVNGAVSVSVIEWEQGIELNPSI